MHSIVFFLALSLLRYLKTSQKVITKCVHILAKPWEIFRVQDYDKKHKNNNDDLLPNNNMMWALLFTLQLAKNETRNFPPLLKIINFAVQTCFSSPALRFVINLGFQIKRQSNLVASLIEIFCIYQR